MQSLLTGTAAVFRKQSENFQVREFPLLPPLPGQVCLDMRYSGICGTDVHIFRKKLDVPLAELIIGHEFIGTIRELGKGCTHDGLGHPITRGDTAIACVAVPCGSCFNCSNDETASCMNFRVTYLQDPSVSPHFHGGFSDHLHSPDKNLVRIPPELDLLAVAAAPCAGPTALRAFEYAGGIRAGELAVVQGSGVLGLFATAYAKAAGATVAVIGSAALPARKEIALELGADLYLDHRTSTAAERKSRIMQLAEKLGRGDGADLVFEASGAAEAFSEGMALVRTRGRYVVPGQYSDQGGITIQPQQITFKAVRIIGSGQYRLDDIQQYLDFLKDHPDKASVLRKAVDRFYEIDDAQRAMEETAMSKSIKAVFRGRGAV